jgi:A/G-specific adenine glycosylase
MTGGALLLPVARTRVKAETVKANGHTINTRVFRNTLLNWGQKHFRPFPWRQTKSPYRILMAEVMLHRTQALQVVPVYKRFVRSYPDVDSLARASRKEIRSALHSLGLHWRIDLVRKMAARIIGTFGGKVPQKREDLLTLPGVSDYVASALRCFAYNIPETLIDTNTVRVVGRLYGLKLKDSSRRNRRFREILVALVDPSNPQGYNYALLDLADQVCTRKRPPECGRCPLARWCLYAQAK